MGVDYEAEGGLGIKLTKELANKLIVEGRLPQDWEDDYDESLSNLGISFLQTGDSYDCDWEYYFVMNKASNLQEAIDSFPKFKEDIKRGLGIDIEYKDVIVICDLSIW